ncbi:MAG: sulfotransferase, partial [Planctomycetales bacterium]|nr:sulfotransferase [Planctomycetales bacterium]
MTLKERPFFIVGNPRSGTTLMRFMLSSHSRIYIPEETGFLVKLASLAGRTFSLAEAKKTIRTIGRMNVEWLDIVQDENAFFESLQTPDLAHLLDGLYRIRIQSYDAQRWGDKGPAYVTNIPALNRIFPDAQFIHLVRDGRDSTISALQKWKQSMRYLDTYYV